jgi:hypothetical protein
MEAAKNEKLTGAYIVLGIIILVVALVIYWIAHTFFPSLGFTYYEPTYLPPGVSIKERRIDIYHNNNKTAEMNFRTVDWVYSLAEYPSEGNNNLGTARQNFSVDSIKPTCSLLTTPQKTKYRLCHWVDYGHYSVYEVRFTHGGTYMWGRLVENLSTKLGPTEIGKFIDSFQPKSTHGFPVLRSEI